MKIKVFGWLLLQDRLNTRDMLRRRHYNIGDDFACLLCGQEVETLDHMIFTCHFSKMCWDKIHIDWGDFHDRLSALHDKQAGWPNAFFVEVFYTAAWSIWKERNNKHFRDIVPCVGSWSARFNQDLRSLQHRVKVARRTSLLSYCDVLG